jgi:hypothetical protein
LSEKTRSSYQHEHSDKDSQSLGGSYAHTTCSSKETLCFGRPSLVSGRFISIKVGMFSWQEFR